MGSPSLWKTWLRQLACRHDWLVEMGDIPEAELELLASRRHNVMTSEAVLLGVMRPRRKYRCCCRHCDKRTELAGSKLFRLYPDRFVLGED